MSSTFDKLIVPDLPLELKEEIINALFIQDEKCLSSIKACSLVSRAFVPLCRKHIFASITLNRVTRNSSTPSSKDFESLLGGTPNIEKYIRNLDYRIVDADLESPALHAALTMLTRVQSLTIDYVRGRWSPRVNAEYPHLIHPNWQSAEMASLRAALRHLLHLPTLTSLNLRQGLFNIPISDLVPSIHLNRLHLGAVDLVGMDLRESLPLDYEPIRLVEFSFRSGTMRISDTHKALNAQFPDGRPVISFNAVRFLMLSINTPKDLQICTEVIKGAEKLNHLDLDIVDRRMSLATVSSIVAKSPTLKRLIMTFEMGTHVGNFLRGLCTGFGSATKSAIASIKLIVMIANCDWGPDECWGELARILTSPPWSALRDVCLEFELWHSPQQRLKDGIQDLPSTHLVKLSTSPSIKFEFTAQEKTMLDREWS